MKQNTDPSAHKEREVHFMEHVGRLLADERMRIATSSGRRAVTNLIQKAEEGDHGVELKRLMSRMDLPDRELQAKMPTGRTLNVTLSRQRLFWLRKAVARLRVICVSPTQALLAGEAPAPVEPAELSKLLGEMALASDQSIPSTVVVLATGGFSIEARTLAEQRLDRTLILVEPNDAGGWTVTGPPQTKALSDLFDPELDAGKRQRVRQFIEANCVDLMTGGLAGDKVAAQTQVPLGVVEDELKAYTKVAGGLVAKRLDGRLILFRETAAQPQASGSGGPDMSFIEKMKALFARRGEEEKKVAFLAERRAGLSQQRDRLFEDMAGLEQKESGLREEFKNASSAITKRRLTSQVLQLRKDIDRRQQLLAMLGQQVNVVSTALHNLELVRQGQTANLPNSEELTADAVRAEEMLADLEASNELAGSVGTVASAGMSAEEQALYEELEKENAVAAQPTARPSAAAAAAAQTAPTSAAPAVAAAAPARSEPRRNEPEPG